MKFQEWKQNNLPVQSQYKSQNLSAKQEWNHRLQLPLRGYQMMAGSSTCGWARTLANASHQ